MVKLIGLNSWQTEKPSGWQKSQCRNEVCAIEVYDASLKMAGPSLIPVQERRLKHRFCCIRAAFCCVAVLIFVLVGALIYVGLRANRNLTVQGEDFNRTNVTSYTKEQRKGDDKPDRDNTATSATYRTDIEEMKFGDIQIQLVGTTENSKDGSLLKRLKRAPFSWIRLRHAVKYGRSGSSHSGGSSGTPEFSAFPIIISLVLACSQLSIFTKIHL